MITLKNTIDALGTDDIKNISKTEIQNISRELLPLQQGLSHSSYVGDSAHSVVILNITDKDIIVQIKAGVFYTGIIAGCSCSDDPSPTDEQNEYCELQFNIDKETAETTVILLKD